MNTKTIVAIAAVLVVFGTGYALAGPVSVGFWNGMMDGYGHGSGMMANYGGYAHPDGMMGHHDDMMDYEDMPCGYNNHETWNGVNATTPHNL